MWAGECKSNLTTQVLVAPALNYSCEVFCVSLVVLYIKFINFVYDCESKKKRTGISRNSEKKNRQIS